MVRWRGQKKSIRFEIPAKKTITITDEKPQGNKHGGHEQQKGNEHKRPEIQQRKKFSKTTLFLIILVIVLTAFLLSGVSFKAEPEYQEIPKLLPNSRVF